MLKDKNGKQVMQIRYKGYIIAESRGHGKALKGAKRTATIQIREPVNEDIFLIKKIVRFRAGDQDQKEKAIARAKQYVESMLEKQP